MRKWKTNDQDLQRKMESQNACEKSISPAEIQSEDQSFSKSQFQPSTSQDIPKVLGIPWNNSTDHLEFTFEGLASYPEEKIVTKRVILSTIVKMFDPLGVLSPVFIVLKILFQQICKKGVDWDDPVEKEVADQWRSVLEDMKKVSVVPINRWYRISLS